MEEGSLRVDGNISIRPVGQAEFGTKTELKNMNSFRFLERGLEAEIARQLEIVKGGGEVEQETLHFDPTTGSLSSLRSKEEAHDYRYFPEPDLVPIAPTEAMLRAGARRRCRSCPRPAPSASSATTRCPPTRPTCSRSAASSATTSRRRSPAAATAKSTRPRSPTGSPASSCPGSATPSRRTRRSSPPRSPSSSTLVSGRKISRDAGKEVLDVLAESGGDPAAIVEERGLAMQGADELSGIVDRALEANPKAVEQFKEGKGKAIGAIVGFVMRETKGRADGGEVNRLIREKIGS